jgi:hypothetical protein
MECGRNNKTEYHEIKPGSVEYDIILTSKDQLPTETREDCFVFRFDVTHPSNLSWHYQGIEVGEDEYRPDNVKDSFALYFDRAGRFTSPGGSEFVNYESGKYAHCYRTKILIPGESEPYWGRLWKEGDELLVGVPFEAVNAWNPSLGELVVDPTFGYTTIGATQSTTTALLANVLSGYTHTASTGDTLTALTAAIKENAGAPGVSVEIALYTMSGGLPNARGTLNSITATSTMGWREVSGLSESMTGGTEYTIGLGNGSATFPRAIARDVMGTNPISGDTTNSTIQNPWNHDAYGSTLASIYGTYAVGGTLLKHPGTDGGFNRNINAGMRG